jgi:hypothetical protein
MFTQSVLHTHTQNDCNRIVQVVVGKKITITSKCSESIANKKKKKNYNFSYVGQIS